MKHYEDYTEKKEDLSDKHQKIVSEEIGKIYDYLTIESFAFRNRAALYFNCTCVCGTQRVVKLQYLKSGHQKSCGCKRGQFEIGELERDDLTGQKFGLWTVLERDTSRHDRPFYRCRCECGTEKLVDKYALKNGVSWHCGCQAETVKAGAAEKYKERFYNGELAKTPQDLTGRRFGRLVVLEKLPYDRDKIRRNLIPYKCVCDCGNEITATYANLVLGDTKSCGCRMREVASKTVKTAQANQEYPDGTSINSIKSALRGVVSSVSKTGVRGVTEVKGKKRKDGSIGQTRYRAVITFKKKTYLLGTYDKLEMAAKARKKAEDRLYGEFLEEYEGSELQAEVLEKNNKKMEAAIKEIREFLKNEEEQARDNILPM